MFCIQKNVFARRKNPKIFEIFLIHLFKNSLDAYVFHVQVTVILNQSYYDCKPTPLKDDINPFIISPGQATDGGGGGRGRSGTDNSSSKSNSWNMLPGEVLYMVCRPKKLQRNFDWQYL